MSFAVVLGLAAVAVLLVMTPAHADALPTCSLTPGQVLINEFVPNPSTGHFEWVELYNTTSVTLSLGGCAIDDAPGGISHTIPAGQVIGPHGFWTMTTSNYFNNSGDAVRLLLSSSTEPLDVFTYTIDMPRNAAYYRTADGGPWQCVPLTHTTPGATNGPDFGPAPWTPGQLEVHHINVGQADATLVVGPTGRTLLIDAGEEYGGHSNAPKLACYVQRVTGGQSLDYLLITHLHSDHLGTVGNGGLWELVEERGFTIGQTLHRDFTRYLGNVSSSTLSWIDYLSSPEAQELLHPAIAVEGSGQVQLGDGVVFDIVSVDGNGALLPGDFHTDPSPPSENDYSIGAVLRFGAFDEWLGGDLDGEFAVSENGYSYHDIEVSVAAEVGDVDVLRANHHGSDHSNSPTFVNQLDPEVSIISVGLNNSYGHPRQSVVDILTTTSQLYLTERGDGTVDLGSAVVAGDIVVSTVDGTSYRVSYHAPDGLPVSATYTATQPARTDSDGDGYFAEVDPDDTCTLLIPEPNGGCDPAYQECQPPVPCERCDANGDGIIGYDDATDTFLWYLSRPPRSPTFQVWRADCNADNKVTPGDAQLIYCLATPGGQHCE